MHSYTTLAVAFRPNKPISSANGTVNGAIHALPYIITYEYTVYEYIKYHTRKGNGFMVHVGHRSPGSLCCTLIYFLLVPKYCCTFEVYGVRSSECRVPTHGLRSLSPLGYPVPLGYTYWKTWKYRCNILRQPTSRPLPSAGDGESGDDAPLASIRAAVPPSLLTLR